MSILVGIKHTTLYEYDRRVSMAPHSMRLRPAPHCRTPIVSYSLNIEPKKHFLNWLQDPFSNYVGRAVFPEPTSTLRVSVDLVADLTPYNPFDFFVEEYAEYYPFTYPDNLHAQLAPFLVKKKGGERFEALLAGIPREKTAIVNYLVDINRLVYETLKYTIRLEPGVQAPEETLDIGWGSCRDFAWLMVQLCRHLGLAARFVSGYLVQLTADQKSLDGPSGPEADFTDLHAWVEVYVPGAGWLGLDPTSGLFAAEGHIPLSCTPEPTDSAPITGAVDPCEVEFSYSNEVTRLHEDPRVTRPFTEFDWEDIDALGQFVDERLAKMDVRLTMGGEPTFVSIDDMQSAQWNTAADGKEKRKLAKTLVDRLSGQFAQGGLLHYGQGKWYPGEPLPRWSYALYWRKDGVPLWRSPQAEMSEETAEGNAKKEADAGAFMSAFCSEMGVSNQAIHPCYEDPFYTLWQSGQLPVDYQPKRARQKHTEAESFEERARATLQKILARGLDSVSGYCLPLAFNAVKQRWQSCLWHFKHQALYLMPGNSPVGYRLPLSSLSRQAKNDECDVHERDPFEPVPQEIEPLKEVEETLAGDMSIHTAMCAEVREGHLYVFMPPVGTLEEYVAILHAVQAASERVACPVRLEGYPPPYDVRLEKLVVAPDPGVIEVNIQPAHNWNELKRITETVYSEARLSRLGTEKFMLDGRHSGTGGGNHVTLGGATPADSPLLRRPDLLRSLITFWQHHPSLSYLFSGLFIGPTSQAPRIDEARVERLYEMEIAFSQLAKGEVAQPWLVDRLFRHLLTDLTGNTHRSEFCIDKLYSPDSATGRLGILEFRSFEMPPHARMSLVQMLLLRTLVAVFWERPYAKPLVDWGHALQDRFMLSHFLWQDFKDVLGFIREQGYPVQDHWFDAFLEFRCPRIGLLDVEGCEVEIRHALEPWHVLGEEATGSGTARYVDSSMERIQVKVKYATPGRYILTCNQKAVPMIPTEEEGCFVAGVRYRAWQPHSALHPTIGVHSPLVFDLFDTWNGRAVGGGTYHVIHPGGRNYEHFPVNALEAEARRFNRFEEVGHTQGQRITPPIMDGGGRFYPHGKPRKGSTPQPVKPNPKYPFTLDLRYD